MPRRRRHSATLTGWTKQAPVWALSFVVHCILAVVLTTITFVRIPPAKKKIAINTEFIEIKERQRPITMRNVFTQAKGAQQSARPSAAAQAMGALADVPVATISPGNLGAALRNLTLKGQASDFDELGKAEINIMKTVSKARASTYEDAIDEFAARTIKVLERQPLLVVFLFDQSVSLIDDRKVINQKIDNVIATLKSQLGTREITRLRWAVVSFGIRHRVELRETTSLDQVKRKVAMISSDPSGVENLLKAIQFSCQTFGNRKRPSFLVVVTDETGDDLRTGNEAQDEQRLAATIAFLRQRKMRLFVFGREANFGYPRAWAPYYDANGKVVDWAWIDAGPESARAETLPHDWFYNLVARNIPSGFGMFEQSLLADRTGGYCFLLSDVPSPYDEKKLYDYRPELVPRSEYDRRTRASSLRTLIMTIIKEWPKYRPLYCYQPPERAPKQIVETVGKILTARQFCSEAYQRLKRIRAKDKYRPKRWEAHRDLILAQLLRMKFLLGQQQEALRVVMRRGLPKPQRGQPFNRYHFYFDAKAPLRGGAMGRREYKAARVALERVIQKHSGTPWAVYAERSLRYLTPVALRCSYYVPHERPKM